MIVLNTQLCDTLDIILWELNSIEPHIKGTTYRLTREEKELLRKILLAKSIKLSDEILKVNEHSIAVVNLTSYQLIFNDVNAKDTEKRIHLSKISAMLNDSEQKKLTWYKLKNLNLS